MNSLRRVGGSGQGGFSLLEMLVAITVLALALGALYRAATGATHNVRTSERYAYAVEFARSLLATNAVVAEGGVKSSGETDSGYQWRVTSRQRPPIRGDLGNVQLHDLEVTVAWYDGSKRKQVVLDSVVEALPND